MLHYDDDCVTQNIYRGPNYCGPGSCAREPVIVVCEVKKQHGERTWKPIERIFMTVLWQKEKEKPVKLDSGVHCTKP